MTKSKYINELPMMEGTTENTNIVVEDNGETKRIPASSLVPENMATTEQLEEAINEFAENMPEGGVSPEEVTTIVKENFPCGVGYEEIVTVNEPLNITWDGNTEGLLCVPATWNGTPISMDYYECDAYYKVSDSVFTDEQIKLMWAYFSDIPNWALTMRDSWDYCVEQGFITDDIVFSEQYKAVGFVRKAGATLFGVTFPEPGVYFIKACENHGDRYISRLGSSKPIEHEKKVIRGLSDKFISENIARKTDIVTPNVDQTDSEASDYVKGSENLARNNAIEALCSFLGIGVNQYKDMMYMMNSDGALFSLTDKVPAGFVSQTELQDVISAVILPNAKQISNGAFYACDNLRYVYLPQATIIDGFSDCHFLEYVVLPEATIIEEQGFAYCHRLRTVDLPKVTKIGYKAFNSCKSLTAVILRSETMCSLTDKQDFYVCSHIVGGYDETYNPNKVKDGYFYVPSALIDAYKSDSEWGTFSTQFRALEDYTVDGTITGELDESKVNPSVPM